MLSIEKYYDWDSYEAPSYKAPTRYGGIFVVTNEVVPRLPYNMRIIAWRGQEKDPRKAPPSYEVFDRTAIVRPDNGLLIEEYERYGAEHRLSTIIPERELTKEEISKNLDFVFTHAGVDYSPHRSMEHLMWTGSYGLSIFNYTFSIPQYRDYILKISNEWQSIPGGYVATQILQRKPWCVFIHGTEPGRHAGVTHLDNKVDAGPDENGFFIGNWLIRDIETGIGVKHADIVLVPSKLMVEEVTRYARKHGVHDGLEKIFGIYHGVDTSVYKPVKVEKTENPKILYIGRLSPVKGIGHLLEIYNILKQDFPSLELNLIGAGELEGWVKEYITRNNLKNVELDTGWKTPEEKVNEMCEADICCFPSLYEPSMMTHFEAMASGRPVAIGFGGCREHTIDDKTAVWIDPRKLGESAEKVKRVIKDEKFASEIGRNARESVEKLYDWNKRLPAYSHVIDVMNTQNFSLLKELEDELTPSPIKLFS